MVWLLWTLKIVLSLLMLLAGGAKVFGAKPLADQFEEFGLSPLTMRIVGALELLAGVGVYVEPVAALATGGLVLLMVGAMAHHRRVQHPVSQLVPSALVMVLAALHTALLLSLG